MPVIDGEAIDVGDNLPANVYPHCQNSATWWLHEPAEAIDTHRLHARW